MPSKIKNDDKNNLISMRRKMMGHDKEIVNTDIQRINKIVTDSKASEEELLALHRELDGKYQSCISNLGKSMWNYDETQGFNYQYIDSDSLRENLLSMKPKLQAFLQGWNITSYNSLDKNSSDVNVTVNNVVNISISFREAKQKVEEMTALNREQTDEIIKKIDELENIQKEKLPRKEKWEKVKPIITFAMDKGVDVAIAILSLVVQMKLGI